LTEWGGDLEVRLLAIGIGREIVVLTGHGSIFTSVQKFPCQPPPVPRMRGGIFIPVEVDELCEQWNNYKPQPLIVICDPLSENPPFSHIP